MKNRPLKQSARLGHGEQRADFAAAARFTVDHHALRIAAEGFDIVANPLQRRDEVELTDIARMRERRIELTEMAVAERAQSVMQGNRDHILTLREIRTVGART